jgi:hypothetical protein
MTFYHEKHCRRPAQLNCSYDTETHHGLQQSRDKELVSFASLSAISGTFNSLSKVLFIFPSRYLFAIGLRPIFSFRRKLPPILHTTSKVRDSKKPCRIGRTLHGNGILTLSDAFFQKDLRGDLPWQQPSRLQFKNQVLDLHFELFPVQSPLLRESCSFSFPPLTYMLKFSG